MKTARVDPVLHAQCLRYFRRLHNGEQLAHHEHEFPGCMEAEPPWPGDPKVRYQVIRNVNHGVGRRAPARPYVLIATRGPKTFACYSTVLQIWTVIS